MARSFWWVTSFTLLSLIANFVFLLGCISPATQDLCLYRVNATLLADGLQKLAFKSNGNIADLHASDLPTYWYWGTSGICDVYQDETRCRYAFPPTQGILSIVEETLRDRLGDDKKQQVDSIVSSWNATLSKIGPTVLSDKEAKFAAQSKASAGLVIIAVILDFAIPVVACCLSDSSNLYYVFPFISGLTAIAAGTLATLSMNNGVHGVVDTGEYAGPGVLVLFVGAALRLLSSLSGPCFTSPPPNQNFPEVELQPWGRPPQTDLQGGFQNDFQNDFLGDRETRNKKIGYHGEHYIHKWLEQEIHGWSVENWTSGLRAWTGKYPGFTGLERDHADFTYVDHSGQMREVLRRAGVPVMPQWSTNTTYHLEVKTTPRECDIPCRVSSNQVRLMKMYHENFSNVYILVRVFRIGQATPGVRFFPDPLSLELKGYLYFGKPDNEGYRPVHIRC